MAVLELLDELEFMGLEGQRWIYKVVPLILSRGKTSIDAREYFETLRELRSLLPDELTTATQIARDREKIVRDAHEERAKILEAAREQAQLLISNDELVKQAERRAEEILKQAQIEADAIRAEAEAWARGVVERLENYLARTQATLEKAKKALAAPTVPSSGRPELHPQRERDME